MARKPRKDRFPNRDLWKYDWQQFYELGSIGHDAERERVKDRCWGTLVGEPVGNQFWYTRSMPECEWNGAVFVVEPGMPMDDMPWVVSDVPVVSTLLRTVIESVAPNSAQFLPIRVKRAPWRMNMDTVEIEIDEAHSNWLFEEGAYWVMNTLVEVDCVNHELEKADLWRRPVLETGRIPSDVVLFRATNRTTRMYCRRVLREACDAAGIKGPQFEKALYFPETNPPPNFVPGEPSPQHPTDM